MKFGGQVGHYSRDLCGGSTAQSVANSHGIGTGLIYTWRKQMLRAAMAGFATVEIKP